ncbi:DNA-binding protein [Ramlibacter sp. GTP1]|uniref:DNA-binding protein n=1 Tax=Ramlibacter albus TaxID=2079448 RepID=A0A923MF30_9BURK|nr:DNA-binding protein [Ramlibacter albus]
MEYSFSLTFKLSANAGMSDDDIMLLLGDAGCTDALVGLGLPGYVGLDFDREARSAVAAILSAIRDVKRAMPDAELVEAGPDFVGLTDIAELAGLTRQNMRKLYVTNPDVFPPPVHGGSTLIWHLSPVLEFMAARDYEIDAAVSDVAYAAMHVNVSKEAILLDQRLVDDVRRQLER